MARRSSDGRISDAPTVAAENPAVGTARAQYRSDGQHHVAEEVDRDRRDAGVYGHPRLIASSDSSQRDRVVLGFSF